jgi:hypothetical protein
VCVEVVSEWKWWEKFRPQNERDEKGDLNDSKEIKKVYIIIMYCLIIKVMADYD